MKRNIAISLLLILLAICTLNSALSETLGTAEWSEADFAFYDSNMGISEKPTAGEWSASYISLKEKEDGQTYRGIRVGSYPEQLLQKKHRLFFLRYCRTLPWKLSVPRQAAGRSFFSSSVHSSVLCFFHRSLYIQHLPLFNGCRSSGIPVIPRLPYIWGGRPGGPG